MIEQVNYDKCPKAVEKPPEDDKKYLPCEACGMFFEHGKRGRPPNSCEWARKKTKAHDNKIKKAKKKVRNNDNFVELPVFEPLTQDFDLKIGDVVYYYFKSIREVIARQYASTYKVIGIDNGVPIIQKGTKSHKEPPIRLTDKTRVYRKVGIEYVDKTDYEEPAEEE